MDRGDRPDADSRTVSRTPGYCRGPAARLAAAILLVTLVAYLPTLGNGFTNWDDNGYVTENPNIRSLAPKALARHFTGFWMGHYHPLTLVVYALEYRLFGLHPTGYHAVSLLLHLLNTLLVIRVTGLLGLPRMATAAAALLFGLHPMHVESVAWVADLGDVLSTFFYLGALAAFLPYRSRRRLSLYAASLGLFLAALLSKSMAISLPLVLLLCDWLARRLDRRALLEKIPFLLLSGGFAWLAISARRDAGMLAGLAELSWGNGILAAAQSLVFYTGKLILPVGLCAFYPATGPGAASRPDHLTSLLAVLGAAAILFLVSRRSRILAFGPLFFLLAAFPVLQLVPSGHAAAADRYTYLPSVGFFMLVAVGFDRLLHRLRNHGRAAAAVRAAATVLVLALAVLTWQRTRVWKDSLTLWDDVIAKFPGTAAAYLGRGAALSERGGRIPPDYRAALRDFDRAVQLAPRDPRSHFGRGTLHKRLGNRDEALRDLDRAVELDPRYADAYFNRGLLLAESGDLARAAGDLDRAADLEPSRASSRAALGKVLYLAGEPAKAVQELSRAIEADASSAEALLFRGLAHLAGGDPDRAEPDLRAALALDPRLTEARDRLGEILGRRGSAGEMSP